MINREFHADKGDLVLYNGERSKIIGVSHCTYTNQSLYDVKLLVSPYEQVRSVMSKSRSLKHLITTNKKEKKNEN